jgi:hypothetical protein
VSTPFQVAGQVRAVTTAHPWEGAGWDTDAQHPADFTLTVPSGWQSGMYAAQAVDDRGYVTYITFVVKPGPAAERNPFAVIVNTNTWNAYNRGGRSNYTGPQGDSLSFLRPSPGATPAHGAIVDGTVDDHVTPGELWVQNWLEDAGYGFDVYTDLDFDRGVDGLNGYRAVILSTHPEYWTLSEFNNLQGYVNQGGDVLYLGGNGLYHMVGYTPDGTVQVFTRPEDRFRNQSPPQYERTLLGVAYETQPDFYRPASWTAPYQGGIDK